MGSLVSYRDILRHHANNRSLQEIAQACGCARSTVQDVLKKARVVGIEWKDVAHLSDIATREAILGRPEKESLFAPIDMERTHREKERDATMTLAVLWEEYYALATVGGKKPYLYTRFCELYRVWCETHNVAATKHHVAGDLGEFDYAGKTMEVCDPTTGEIATAYLFVACLPYSQKTFVRAYPDMRVAAWIQASIDAFEFFGGVPRLLTIDNLKVGVTKHAHDEIVLNRTFREFAEHFNVAVIPHAPRRPTGKGSVESNVGKIANKIRLQLRECAFFSFEELNEAISKRLIDLNARPFQKREGTRDSVFAELEAPSLQPLPQMRFEISTWGPACTVPKSYHVMCTPDHVYYSVPWRYVGKPAEVRTTATSVQVFSEGILIATHVRDKSAPRGWHITINEHRPRSHSDWATHDSSWFRQEAAKVGPSCSAVVEGFLGAGTAEEAGWQWCEKLLRRLERVDARDIEDVCALALSCVPEPSFKTVNTLIKNHSKAGNSAQVPKAVENPWAIRRFS